MAAPRRVSRTVGRVEIVDVEGRGGEVDGKKKQMFATTGGVNEGLRKTIR
jgi:hypothetical protein